MEAAIRALAEEVWGWCDRTGALGRVVTVKLRYADFRTLTRSRTGDAPVAGREAPVAASLTLAQGLFPLERPVRLLGVTVSGFEAGVVRESTGQAAFPFDDASSAGRPGI